jgi:hypothetical protein
MKFDAPPSDIAAVRAAIGAAQATWIENPSAEQKREHTPRKK